MLSKAVFTADELNCTELVVVVVTFFNKTLTTAKQQFGNYTSKHKIKYRPKCYTMYVVIMT